MLESAPYDATIYARYAMPLMMLPLSSLIDAVLRQPYAMMLLMRWPIDICLLRHSSMLMLLRCFAAHADASIATTMPDYAIRLSFRYYMPPTAFAATCCFLRVPTRHAVAMLIDGKHFVMLHTPPCRHAEAVTPFAVLCHADAMLLMPRRR